MSTDYPAEAAMFERKARELMDRHGISEAAVAQALAEISEHPASSPPPASEPWPQRPAERGTMIEAALLVLEEEDNRAMRARELWDLIESRGLYTSLGKTPWATIGAKLATETAIFERVAPGRYRLNRHG
jgi:HB1, ASXL, restriction endonuclease HTH domain/Protein of unknown function (DUF2786)